MPYRLCHRAVACRPGVISATLTGRYRRAHPGALDPGVPVTGPAAIRTVTAGDRWWCYPALRHPRAGHGPAAGYRRLITAKARARRPRAGRGRLPAVRRAGDGAQPSNQ